MRPVSTLAWALSLTACLVVGCTGAEGDRNAPGDAASQIETRVHRIVAEQTGVDVRALRNSHTFRGDLACDDLDVVELTMAFEDEFQISISDADAESFKSIGDVIAYLVRRSAK